jgi:glutaminase
MQIESGQPNSYQVLQISQGIFPQRKNQVDEREHRLFVALDQEKRDFIFPYELKRALPQMGLRLDDARLKESMAGLEQYGEMDHLSYENFCRIIRPNILLIEAAIQGNMTIPDFEEFCKDVTSIFEKTQENREGQVANYIPQLARVNPDQYAIALCTIDGQRFTKGDADAEFCIQSCCKPFLYSMALEEWGEEYVHRYIGHEPSGRQFNELTLGADKKPHNPMVNSGAIMCSSLIKPHFTVADRFDYVVDRLRALNGGTKPNFSNPVYLSERQSGDRNYAIGYFLREHGAFPEGTDLISTLEFYFQCCSIEVNTQMMSVMAATLANEGVCPVTGERVFKPQTVQNCLSLMYSCGMYDFSGEFTFTIGLPAKSGVGGGLLVIVPGVMGLCLWSPRLDPHGNSVRGVEFCKRLVKQFNLHKYDNLSGLTEKVDPRVNRIHAEAKMVNQLIWAASKGDLGAIQRLVVRGSDLNAADYDKRTPLHLAASEGQEDVVQLFIEEGIDLNPRDRWGGTPFDDAYRHGHGQVARLLETHGAVRKQRKINRNFSYHSSPGEKPQIHQEGEKIVECIWAASKGDLKAIVRLVAQGINLNAADYDMRTPLHLAASEGQEDVISYFISQGVYLNPRDRWGGTPLDDAYRHKHSKVTKTLEAHGAIRSQPELNS